MARNQEDKKIQNSKFHKMMKLDSSGEESFIQLPHCFFWDFPALSDGARRCYVTLIKYAHKSIVNDCITENGIPIIWPSIETITTDMSYGGCSSLSTRTVQRYLVELRDVGLLSTYQIRKPHTSDTWLLHSPYEALQSAGKLVAAKSVRRQIKRRKFNHTESSPNTTTEMSCNYTSKMSSMNTTKMSCANTTKMSREVLRVVPRERVKEELRLAPATGADLSSPEISTGNDTRCMPSDTGKYIACDNFHNPPADVAAMMSGGDDVRGRNKESPAPARASTGEASKGGKQNCNTMLKYFGEKVNAGLGEKAPLFGGKERSLMKRLIDHYGYEIIQSAVDYLVNNWAVFKKKFPDYEFGAYPNVNILWAFRDTLIPLASSKEPKKEAAKRGGSIWG